MAVLGAALCRARSDLQAAQEERGALCLWDGVILGRAVCLSSRASQWMFSDACECLELVWPLHTDGGFI